jgi:hypothetical protein
MWLTTWNRHWLLGHLLRVKRQKSLDTRFFFVGCVVGNNFILDQQLIQFVRENYCNCASCRKFHANEFFKNASKFPNGCHTNTSLTCANEHYAANLHVNAQLGAQSCPSNQNRGLATTNSSSLGWLQNSQQRFLFTSKICTYEFRFLSHQEREYLITLVGNGCLQACNKGRIDIHICDQWLENSTNIPRRMS